MDLIILTAAFAGLVIIVLFYFVFQYQKRQSSTETGNVNIPERPVPRRAVGNRNRIRIPNRAEVQDAGNQQEEADEDNKQTVNIDDPKIGAKKRAKLEAKAEKKAQREAEQKLREQKKKQQEKDEAERKLKEEKEKLEEEKLEEEKKRLQEEKERKEEEEYQKMKEAFTIEEEGFDEEDDTQINLLQNFTDHIKEQKIVMLEDLAAKFKLRIQTVISRIEDLLANGTLTGVIDDRGKFIYITREELEAVANFVKKRGRVTIQELVENSNFLIKLS